MRTKFGIPNSDHFLDIGQNSDRVQFLIKVSCQNSRASNDTDMKLGPVTKLYKRNKTTSKKITITSYRQAMTFLLFSDL